MFMFENLHEANMSEYNNMNVKLTKLMTMESLQAKTKLKQKFQTKSTMKT